MYMDYFMDWSDGPTTAQGKNFKTLFTLYLNWNLKIYRR
jgi:hypothetical protein